MSEVRTATRSSAQHVFDALAHGSQQAKGGKARKYVSKLDMRSSYDGQLYVKSLDLCWEVMASTLSPGKNVFPVGEFRIALARATRAAAVGQYTTPPEAVAALKLLRFKTTMVPDFTFFNLDAVVYALSSFMAFYTWNPDVKASALFNEALRVSALDQPLASHAVANSAVFIPQALAGSNSSALFGVFVLACNMTGAHVYTDHLALDAEDKPRIELPDGVMFPYLCSKALSILAELYSQAGTGDMFALAATCGLHSINSVVGHADEGGYVRDLLRQVRFCTPFGALQPSPPVSGGVGGLDLSLKYEAVSRWVDSYSLLTAAAVAHCDPLVYESGERYFFTSVSTEGALPEEMARANLAKVGLTVGTFAKHYARALTDLFGLTAPGIEPLAASYLVTAHTLLATDITAGVVRHAGHETMCPYFWIEPTALLRRHHFGTIAEREGYGSLAGPLEVIERPMLPGAQISGCSNAFYSEVTLEMPSLRRSPLMLWALGDKFGSGGNLFFRQLYAEGVGLVGPGVESGVSGFEKDVPVGAWAWRRGQSKIVHPAEVLNIGGTVLLRVVHSGVDTTSGYPSMVPNEGIPSQLFLKDAKIVFQSARAFSVDPGAACTEAPLLRRRRDRANRALEAVMVRNRQGGVYPASEAAKISVAPLLAAQARSAATDLTATQEETLKADSLKGEAVDRAETLRATAGTVKPSRVHGANVAPKLPQGGRTAVNPAVVDGHADGGPAAAGGDGGLVTAVSTLNTPAAADGVAAVVAAGP